MSQSLASLSGALVAATLLAGGYAGAASAETLAVAAMGSGYTAMDAPLGSPTELRVDLKGSVAPRCELVTPPAEMSRLPLTRDGESQSGFAIDCNTPFILRVRSGEGGFASVDPTPGIETLVPYQVSVAVGTDGGRQDLGWCDAAALTEVSAGSCAYAPAGATRGWSSGEAVAIRQTGALRLRWKENTAGAPLLGAYRDTLIIELEVRS